jgi:hypothetical protein
VGWQPASKQQQERGVVNLYQMLLLLRLPAGSNHKSNNATVVVV